MKELKAFKRVSLDPGESKIISFDLDLSSFAYYNLSMKYIVEAGEFDILVGNSSRDQDLKKKTITIDKTIELNY